MWSNLLIHIYVCIFNFQDVWNFQHLDTILDNLAETEDSYDIKGENFYLSYSNIELNYVLCV